MSNLGTYQTITRISKAVGGPKVFMGLVLGTGIAIGSIATSFVAVAVSKNKKDKDSVKKLVSNIEKQKTYETIIADESNENILFNVGDKFKVLEIDKDAVLIDKIGDKNSPYYVAKDFLKKISDFKEGDN